MRTAGPTLWFLAALAVVAGCRNKISGHLAVGNAVDNPPSGSMPGTTPPTQSCNTQPTPHPITKLPRTSNYEFQQIAADLIGAPLPSADLIRWTPIAQVDGFDTMTESRVDAAALSEQLQTAETLAERVATSSAVRSACPQPNDPPSPCPVRPSYVAQTDFSSTQGQGCWSYRDSGGAQLTFDPANMRWFSMDPGLFVWANGAHPGVSLDAVRRWVAPAEGSVALTGMFSSADPRGGDGIIVAIQKNGADLFRTAIADGAAPESFDLKITVKRGDTVDFIVDRNVNNSYDTTAFAASIALDAALPEGGWNWANCGQPFVTRFASRAFRRPLRADELADYQALLESTWSSARADGLPGAFREGLKAVVQAILLSPSLMYKPELVPGGFDKTEESFRVASRLSLFFRSSFADEELWSLAEGGKLTDPAVVAEQAARLMQQYADRFTRNFGGQWFGFREPLEAPPPDPLAASMDHEANDVFAEVLSSDLPPEKLINPGFTLVDERLAAAYGLPFVPDGNLVHRIPSMERGGILFQGSFLTSTARGASDFGRVIHRGIWTLNRTLCRSLPMLDQATREEIAASFMTIDRSLPLPEQMKMHRSRSSRCFACHSQMDPIGLALENYDSNGMWRDHYADGAPISNDFDFNGTPVRNPKELAAMVEASPEFRSCVAKKLLTYALSRPPADDERCAVEALADPRGASPSLKTMTVGAMMKSLDLLGAP